MKENSIHFHKTLDCPIRIIRHKEGSAIATFFYLNPDLTIQKTTFSGKEIDKIGIGSISKIIPFEDLEEMSLNAC